jgi:hypothetical protein
MLRTGVEGWTENDILRYCRLSSGRNYASELERRLDIQLERIDEKNPDGIGSHLRYRFTGRGDVLKVIRLVGNDSNLLIVFYVQIVPDDFVMQLHRF